MTTTATNEKTARIAALNDQRRRCSLSGCRLTPDVLALSADDKAALLAAVASFEDFTPESDPWQERDFGAVEVGGEKFFWKIDYYDRALQFHSPDPADPRVTRRVLTICCADEY